MRVVGEETRGQRACGRGALIAKLFIKARGPRCHPWRQRRMIGNGGASPL